MGFGVGRTFMPHAKTDTNAMSATLCMYADMKLLAIRGRFATFADVVFCRVHY